MKKYGLLGHPLGHSLSRKFHNDRFQELSIDAVYVNFDLEDITLLPELLQGEADLCGMNVTIPYKQAVMEYLDALDPKAEAIGAVNVIKVVRGEKAAQGTKIPGLWLKGYNSDVVGFTESLRLMLNDTHRRALVLGTGGASKAVMYALRSLGIEPQYVSRRHTAETWSYEMLTPEIIASHTVIVNTTPLGMYPNVDACPPIPYEAITPQHVCFDLINNPDETLFMKRAAQQGAAVKCGQEMFVKQALESYDIWTREE